MSGKNAFLGLMASLVLTTATHAQDASEPPPAAEHAGTTWHVMIATYEPSSPKTCDSWVYKVTTNDPIVLHGPETITQEHADTVISAWLAFLRARSPTAYRWINGATGEHANEIYFRASQDEARAAFAADGHQERDKSCAGSVIYKQGISKFAFDPPADFASPNFGKSAANEGKD